jgi:hypothetical protein
VARVDKWVQVALDWKTLHLEGAIVAVDYDK